MHKVCYKFDYTWDKENVLWVDGEAGEAGPMSKVTSPFLLFGLCCIAGEVGLESPHHTTFLFKSTVSTR